jgi:hypothetical protein
MYFSFCYFFQETALFLVLSLYPVIAAMEFAYEDGWNSREVNLSCTYSITHTQDLEGAALD